MQWYDSFNRDSESERVLILPKSSLGYAANNVYPQFPPLMSDGRSLISNWQAESTTNESIMAENRITSNWEYRKFLTHHAKEIMQNNVRESANDTGYMKPFARTTQGNQTPQWFINMNAATPTNRQSDLKETYLNQIQTNEKKVTWTM